MKVTEAIKKRRAIRGFKPDPVPEETLREILDIARYAPSNCNTQPWHFSVVSGQARDDLEKALLQEVMSGKQPTPGFPPGNSCLEGVYKQRQYDCAYVYYGTMGIAREDRDKRQQLALKNQQFFGAPHVGFLSMPANYGPVNGLDVGIYLQTLMLLLVEYGLASCAQGALILFPDPIKAIGAVPEGNEIICGLSFGYEDVGARINDVTMTREPLESQVTFIS